MLVEVLPRPEAEEEAVGEQRRGRRGSLRHDRRVHPDRWAGDGRADLERRGRVRHRSDHWPDERALALRLDPRMEVVRDRGERQSGGFRPPRVID